MSEPAEPTAPAPSVPSEEEAWSLVLASWGDEAVHRAYLGRFVDLEGFAVAGGRYRSILSERPRDPLALRMREEVLRKATVLGLASLPRTQPSQAPVIVKRIVVLLLVLLGCAALWAAYKILLLLGARS